MREFGRCCVVSFVCVRVFFVFCVLSSCPVWAAVLLFFFCVVCVFVEKRRKHDTTTATFRVLAPKSYRDIENELR